jgi:hypothetical protein
MMSFLAMRPYDPPVIRRRTNLNAGPPELTDIVLNCDGDEFLLASKGLVLGQYPSQPRDAGQLEPTAVVVKFASSLSTQYIYQLKTDELKSL